MLQNWNFRLFNILLDFRRAINDTFFLCQRLQIVISSLSAFIEMLDDVYFNQVKNLILPYGYDNSLNLDVLKIFGCLKNVCAGFLQVFLKNLANF
jgi:hypothetical protein